MEALTTEFSKLGRAHMALLAFLIGVGTLVVPAVAKAIYTAIISPLRRVPGPWYCAWSSIPATYKRISGVKAHWTHALHLKYGPIVRIGPKEVSCVSIASLKKIYGTPFEKGGVYDFVSFDVVKDSRHLLGIRDAKEATKLRRVLLPLFATGNLKEMTDLFHAHMTEFDDRIEGVQKKEESVDFLMWYQLLLYDVIGHLAFDKQFNMVKKGELDDLVKTILGSATSQVLRGFFPRVHAGIAQFGTASWRAWALSNKRLAQYANDLYIDWLGRSPLDRHSKVMQSFHDHHIGSNGQPNIEAVGNEATAVLVAGSDTTSTTLTFLSYLLALHPDCQRKLQVELDEAFPDPQYLQTVDDVPGLPYLDGVVKEAMRLYPSVPGGPARRTPEAGVVLEGVYLPPKIEVYCQAYSMHRIPEVWGVDYAEFKPERHLNETLAMKQAMCTFSYGPRACVGLNLANAQLRLYTAHLFRKYRYSLHESATVESMVIRESFVSPPMSGQARLIIERRV